MRWDKFKSVLCPLFSYSVLYTRFVSHFLKICDCYSTVLKVCNCMIYLLYLFLLWVNKCSSVYTCTPIWLEGMEWSNVKKIEVWRHELTRKMRKCTYAIEVIILFKEKKKMGWRSNEYSLSYWWHKVIA